MKIQQVVEKKNYLVMFSPIDVSFKENDRTNFGDCFKKPTNFFAISFKMEEKFEMFVDKNYNAKSIYKDTNGMSARSEITPIYAQNFYKRFIKSYVDNLKGEKND